MDILNEVELIADREPLDEKYANAVPLYRQERDWQQIGTFLTRARPDQRLLGGIFRSDLRLFP